MSRDRVHPALRFVAGMLWMCAAGCSDLPLEPTRDIPPMVYGDDHGDTPASATLLVPPSITPGHLGVGDIDYFRIDVRWESLLIVRTTGDTDTQGYLHCDDGAEFVDDHGGAGYNFRIDAWVFPGSCYVAVSGYGNYGTGPYTLRVDSK